MLVELATVARVQLDYSKRLVVRGQQRNAHDRADFQVGDRGAGMEVLVVAGVLAEHGLLLAEHEIDDRPADACRGLVVLYSSKERLMLLGSVLESFPHQSLARGILEHEEEPLRTGKDL